MQEHIDWKSLEQILKDLKINYKLVEEAIGHLNVCRQQVDDSANAARLEVRSEVDSILDHIRQREVQLLRQIDMMHSHYGDAFHIQNAKLHQILGTLKHALYSLESRQQSVTTAITQEDLQFVEVVRQQNLLLNAITYQGDVEEFYKLIERFGTLNSSHGFSTWHSSEELMSKCLPSKLEEYDDADHQLFYKTLHDLQLEKVGEQKTKTTFDQTSIDDWLKKPSMAQNTSSNFALPDCFLMEDISFWLKEGLRERILEEAEAQLKQNSEDNGSFEIVNDSSDSDSSIELLAKASVNTSFQSSLPSIRSLSTKSPCKDRRNCCNSESSVDIENLLIDRCSSGGFSCHEYVDNWLVDGMADDPVNMMYKSGLRMADVCMANECCDNFGECVCKARCLSKACELMEDMHMDVSGWLRSPARSDDQFDAWLKTVSLGSGGDEKKDCSEKKWEKNSSFYPISWSKSPPKILHQQQDTGSNRSFIRKDFERYFQNDNQHVWLAYQNLE